MTDFDHLVNRDHPGRITTPRHDSERVFRDALALLIVKELRRGQHRGGPLKAALSVGTAAGSGAALAFAFFTLKRRFDARPHID